MSGIRWSENDKDNLRWLREHIQRKTGALKAPTNAKVIRWALRRAVRQEIQKRKDGR